jgi:hypothetical protein
MDEIQGLIPALRPLDCTLLTLGGQELVRVRDGLGISPDAAVPLPLFALAQLFNGSRSVLDVQAEITRQTGEIFPSEDLLRIIRELDEAYFLDSERFRNRLREVLQEWNGLEVRPATHAGPGRCYPDEPANLAETMEEMYRRPGAADPSALASSRGLRAVLAPHIDFRRGGHTYTWAYHEIRRRGRADVYVILGTCHQQMQHPFAITSKSYGTPWGPVRTDRAFLDRLERIHGQDLRRDEFNHKNEHSIEFQVIFLRHALGTDDFTIVPILCGGFHESVQAGTQPDLDQRVGGFLDSLAATIAAERADGRKIMLIGGVDLAHVGRHFGDRDRLTPEFLAEVRSRDHELLKAAAAVDPRALFQEIARDQDQRRICGFGPIYTILGLLERDGARSGRVAGQLLSYDQAVDLENDLCVSFASMAIEER